MSGTLKDDAMTAENTRAGINGAHASLGAKEKPQYISNVSGKLRAFDAPDTGSVRSMGAIPLTLGMGLRRFDAPPPPPLRIVGRNQSRSVKKPLAASADPSTSNASNTLNTSVASTASVSGSSGSSGIPNVLGSTTTNERKLSGGSMSILQRASASSTSNTSIANASSSSVVSAPSSSINPSTNGSSERTADTDGADGTHHNDSLNKSNAIRSSNKTSHSRTNTNVSIPAHVNSYAALLAAQSKLGPIPVPQGFAIANAVNDADSTTSTNRTPYLPGFQPKGVVRSLTQEFITLRRVKRSQTELEEQRIDRRLAKLIALHFRPESNSHDKGSFWEVRRKTKEVKELEQKIVFWQPDNEVSKCPICDTKFGIGVRKHHCRLCGLVVCASPYLLDREDKSKKCSGTIISDTTGRISDENFGVRICKHCRTIIHKRQFWLDDSTWPILNLYDALVRIEREIEQSLPEFQEMVLGLQKNGTRHALLDAGVARKQLLTNFAKYDELSKRIKTIESFPDSERLQHAIFTRANWFLQQNMLPLQNLPKSTTPKSFSLSKLNEEEKVEFLEDDLPNDPEELRCQLEVLLEQESMVFGFIESATAARKFDDAKTLKRSHEELCTQILRLQRRLGDRG